VSEPKKPKESRLHRASVTRMLRATGLLHVPEEAPLVTLLKDLAKELDLNGGARTRQQYLSALKDVRRVLRDAPGETAASTGEPSADDDPDDEATSDVAVDPKVSDFDRFKRSKGGAAAG
jgi:hypothetical protein